VQTYHAFAATIVREHGLLVGVEQEAGLLSEAQQWQLVLSCIEDLPPFEAIELRSSAGIVRATLELASSVADHIVSLSDIVAADERIIASPEAPDEIRDASLKRIELCRVVERYIAAKRGAQKIDFGDQVVKTVEILEGHAEVRTAYRQRFPVILLDEYQDTNVAQRRMVEALAPAGGAITAVGDARQAIYGWRGATMFNLLGFPSHFPKGTGNRGYGPIPLSENFRSGRRILDVANAVVTKIDAARRPGGELRPFGDNGEGDVALALFTDGQAEASSIADQCERLHGRRTREDRAPVAWRDIAVLVRRKATMEAIHDELAARDIPVEVVGLPGLLRTPEVLEIVAWLRCLEGRPSANRWLARILLGPRWRIHYRDLALCARWAAEQNQELRLRLAGGDPEVARDLAPGEVGVSLSEALEHLDAIEGLGTEARRRLDVFRRRLSDMRAHTTGPLLDIVQEVIDRSGVIEALDSSRSRYATAARQNIASFLDHVASFAPVEGQATLRSFLAYLAAADEAEETLEAVQPAESDSVKLMTVHAAKGLEFECVFIPAVAASRGRSGYVMSVFPDTRAGNPLTSYRTLPYAVREDAEHLPRYRGKLSEFREEVRERAAEDERRLFYVALTRAKQRLFVSAAWWYGRGDRPKGPSEFWDELEGLASDGLVDLTEKAECPEDNPIVESLRGAVVWPPEPRPGAADSLFPGGAGAVADRLLAGELSMDMLTRGLSGDERADYDRLLNQRLEEISAIGTSPDRAASRSPAVPDVLFATQYVALQNEEVTAWDLVRPLPSPPSAARRVGTEVHRLIEGSSRSGVASEALDDAGVSPPYPEETELDVPSGVSDPREATAILERWHRLYGDRKVAVLPSGEPMIELPFILPKDGRIIRGRIDAVYETDDGGLEIVDFKTGRVPEPKKADQLALYAEALRANGLVPENISVKLTYAALG
jgi:DNA helicase-2/ATP-dependent DNA helicase PcrA